MILAFDGPVVVHYHQIYVVSDPDSFIDGFDDSWAGQANGLCGAAVPGLLFLITGLHTGHVHFTVEIHDTAPPTQDRWEDVVEASFRPATTDITLQQWAGGRAWPLPLRVIDYRVRYCAAGMDEGSLLPARVRADAASEPYLLQFWPAAPAPDAVVRCGSRDAAYWHRHAADP